MICCGSALQFELDLAVVFEGLTDKCLQLQMADNPNAVRSV
jgi:hypothetical protein